VFIVGPQYCIDFTESVRVEDRNNFSVVFSFLEFFFSFVQRAPIVMNKKAMNLPVVYVHNNMTVEQLAAAIGKGIGKFCLFFCFSVPVFYFNFSAVGSKVCRKMVS
jgi:hypothetical protein